MAGHHPQDAGEEPDVDPIESTNDARDEDGFDGPGLPSVLEGSAWSRMEDEAAVVYWQVPGPPHVEYEDVQPTWKRWLRSRVGMIAIAAVVGGVAGGLAVGALGSRNDPDAGEAVEALRNSIGQLASEVRSLKQGVGEGSQTTAEGLAAIEQRIAGAEQAQATLTARIKDLSTKAAAPPAVSPEITGSVAPPPLPVAPDWILWRVRNGRALVQGGGGYFEVVPGSALPGLGIVQRIVKEDGRWVLYTAGAVIVARG
jgi:hypothetical protein